MMLKKVGKKFTVQYTDAILKGCVEMFNKCVDMSIFEKGSMDEYWTLHPYVRDGKFLLSIGLDQYSILDHAHPDFMKKECMESRKFGEFVHQKEGLVNEVYVTQIPIESKDGGTEFVKCDMVFE